MDVLTTRNPSSVGTDPSLLKAPADVTVHRTITLDLPFGVKKTIKRLLTGSKPPRSKRLEHPRWQAEPDQAIRPGPSPPRSTGHLGANPHPCRTSHRPRPQHRSRPHLLPPFSTLRVAESLRKQFPRLPIVLDFRDEWLSTTFDVASFNFSRTDAHAHSPSRPKPAPLPAPPPLSPSRMRRAAKFARAIRGSLNKNSNTSQMALTPHASRLLDRPRLRVQTPGSSSPTSAASTPPRNQPGSSKPSSPCLQRSAPGFSFRFIGHIEEPRYRAALLELGRMVELQGYFPSAKLWPR